MIVSIMQPYLLPYIGYFQLIANSDLFVLYDDAQYMKGGWINRNRILLTGLPHWLTVPVAHAAVSAPILARAYRLDQAERHRLKALVGQAYRKAPQFAAVSGLLDELFDYEDANVARFNAHALGLVCERLGVRTPMAASSSLGRDASLHGPEAVIDICRILGADTYLNPVGGAGLYSAEQFARAGLGLSFLRPGDRSYAQGGGGGGGGGGGEHVARLSILDVLMWCASDDIDGLMAACSVVSAAELEAERA